MEPVYFLLVDDLEENLISLEALLRREGLVCLSARSSDEALEILLRQDVALAIVDVRMPGLNGFELAELMRGNERTRRIPIIFVTAGTADTQRRFRGYEAGAVDFIYKPIEADILRSKAEVFLELYRQRQQIAAQRDALEAQAEALRKADSHKDEFLAMLAHELRSHFAPLRHGLDLLVHTPEQENACEIIAVMDRQLNHLVRLIDDLLDVSRISQGKLLLRKARIRLQEVITAAVETSRPMIDAAGHDLVVALPPEPLWLEADLMRLAQVVSNLLNNAAKYTPEGGRIEVRAWQEGQDAVVSVADNGLGIPAQRLEEVFDLFTQVDQHENRAQGGLGIGLALVRRLMGLHGGTVSVASPGSGQGSVFTLRLPLAASPAAQEPAIAADDAPRSAPATPLRILIIDDSRDVAQTIGWMLEELGHGYHLLHDAQQALPVAAAYRPDAILLDIGLPGTNGYEVCRILRQDPRLASVPIIAHTGWSHAQDKAAVAEAGFDHYLVKPASFRALEALIGRLG
jgi:signal transduction histidine kinase